MVFYQWLPLALALMIIVKSVSVYRRARGNPQAARFLVMGVCLWMAILLYWYYPLLLAWFHWPVTNRETLLVHGFEDSLLIVAGTMVTIARIHLANGLNTSAALRKSQMMTTIMIVTLSSMTLLLVLAIVHGDNEDANKFTYDPAHSLFLIAYRLMAFAFMIAIMVYLSVFLWHLRRIAPAPLTKMSIWFGLVAHASVITTMLIGIDSLSVRAGTTTEQTLEVWARVTLFAFIVLSAVSFNLDSGRLKAPTSRLADHLWNIIWYQNLKRLWQHLTALEPSVVLKTLTPRDRSAFWSPTEMRILLRRRVQEIMDARRRLGIVPAAGEDFQIVLLAIPTIQFFESALDHRVALVQTNKANTATLEQMAIREAMHIALMVLNQQPTGTVALYHPESFEQQLAYLTAVAHVLPRELALPEQDAIVRSQQA